MKRGYAVYKNNSFITFIPSRSMKACKDFVKNHIHSTHIGEWRRTLTSLNDRVCYEREYATTIGVYITFKPGLGE